MHVLFLVFMSVLLSVAALKSAAKTPQELGFVDAFSKGYSINELDKKTAQELVRFHNDQSFRTIKSSTKPIIPNNNLDDDRQNVLDDITKELDEYKPPISNATSKTKMRIDKREIV
jgi:hypothetical protein